MWTLGNEAFIIVLTGASNNAVFPRTALMMSLSSTLPTDSPLSSTGNWETLCSPLNSRAFRSVVAGSIETRLGIPFFPSST